MNTKYVALKGPADVCKWIDSHPLARIIAITQDRIWHTIFYTDYDDIERLFDHAAAEVQDIDPGFLVPAGDPVPLKSAPTFHQNAVPQPSTIC